MLEDIRDQKILFCVLNWGLGHASRSTPIIRQLSKENEVHLASDGGALTLLQKEFPKLITHNLPGYDITYARQSLAADMTLQLPKIAGAFLKEQRMVSKLVAKERYAVIISDHRYGCRSTFTKNIFIAHQINIMADSTFLSKSATLINISQINKFDSCWIPDTADSRLSGKLSSPNNLKIPTHFIGPQSRMVKAEVKIKYNYAIVLSGPEPARTRLEHTLYSLCQKNKTLKFVMVRGTDVPSQFPHSDHIEVYNLLSSDKLNQILNQSGKVICRAGYSSIMDLFALDKKAILIPTPGQTEQEYLGKFLNMAGLFTCIEENEIDTLGPEL